MANGNRKDDVTVKFGGDTSGLERAMKRVREKTRELGSVFADFGRGLAGVFGLGGGAVAGADALAKRLADLDATAKSLGLTLERFSELEFAVGRTSQLDAEGLADALQSLTEKIGEAAAGDETLRKLFSDLGAPVEELVGLPLDQAFLRIIDGIGKVRNAYRQGTAADELFSDQWRQIILLSQAGTEQLEAYAEQMREIGTPTTEAAEAAAALNNQIAELKATLASVVQSVGPGVLDFLNRFGDAATAAHRGTAVDILARDIRVLQERLAVLNGEDTSLWARTMRAVLTDGEIARQVEVLEGRIATLQDRLAEAAELNAREMERARQEPITPPEEAADIPINANVVEEDEEKKQAARRRTAAVTAETNAEQLSDTRATARAEGAYWQAEHDLINSLQDKNAKAVEDARDRMNQAVEDLRTAGAADFRVRYYEQRAGISDEEAVPTVTFNPVVSEEQLAAMPQRIQDALDAANITVTIRPILDEGAVGTVGRASDQEGHDET